MNDRTLLYYMGLNDDSLTPDSTQTLPINEKEWYVALKPYFNDLIWQYFTNRVVFIDDRFKFNDDDFNIIGKIKRAFAINLITKNYEYENLYNSTILEFNPLWNVDGVEGIIKEYTNESEGSNEISGTDSKLTSNTGTITKNETRTINKDGDNSDTYGGIDTTDNSKATYDSGNHLYPTDSSSLGYGKTIDYSIDEDTTDTFHGGENRDLRGSDTTTHSSTNDNTNVTNHRELEMHIRQGNIGVTKSTELLEDYRNLSMFDFFKLVVKDCVNQCTYAVE